MVFVFAIENHVGKTSFTSCERNPRRWTTHDNSAHRKKSSASRRHGSRRRTTVKAFLVLEKKDTLRKWRIILIFFIKHIGETTMISSRLFVTFDHCILSNHSPRTSGHYSSHCDERYRGCPLFTPMRTSRCPFPVDIHPYSNRDGSTLWKSQEVQ